MENVCAAVIGGMPLSVTRIVMILVPGPWPAVGVQENSPFVGLIEAPVGAPAARLNDRPCPSGSLKLGVKDSKLPLVTDFGPMLASEGERLALVITTV